jgi:hypothetical protein
MTEIEQNLMEAGGHEPKLDGRAATSAINGRRGGARRGSGFKVIDLAKWNRLFFGGASAKDIAHALGISRRTLKRRIADRLRQDSPM